MNDAERHDVVIAGAGVIGLACAWRAARRGMSVLVLERDRVAAGASGVAAGMLAPVGEASWGEEGLLAFNLASLGLWDRFAAELQDDSGAGFGYRRIGALHVAADRDEAEQLRHRHEVHRRHELEARWLRASECRQLEPGLASAIAGGIEAPDEATVDPARLCDALAAAVREAGGEIVTGTEVVGAGLGAGERRLRTADGREHAADAIVVAAGVWSGGDWLPAELRPPLRPIKGEVLTLRGSPGEPVCERIVAGERVYVVPREDGRLIVGATVEERGFETTVTAGGVHELLREAYRLLPEIAELELADARAGLRPGTPDNLPVVGAVDDGLILACGHFRNGVLQAPATADAVTSLLAGENLSPELAPLAPGRFGGGEGAGRRQPEAVAR
jgi:glycine oxidase